MKEQKRDPYEDVVLNSVSEFGWHGVQVPAGDDGPKFEYTIGLLEMQHPEIIIVGMRHDVAHAVLWQIVRDLRDGRRFEEPVLYEQLLKNYACTTRPVHPSQFPLYFGYGLWHQQHIRSEAKFAAMQCIWPDRKGLFPWEDGCEISTERQPLLYEPHLES